MQQGILINVTISEHCKNGKIFFVSGKKSILRLALRMIRVYWQKISFNLNKIII